MMNKAIGWIFILAFIGISLAAGREVYASQGVDSMNQIANAYCVGKGYDQGSFEDGQAWCQTITIKQDAFTLPRQVTP